MDRTQILKISRDSRGVIFGKAMEMEPRHTPKIQQTVGCPPIAEGVDADEIPALVVDITPKQPPF